MRLHHPKVTVAQQELSESSEPISVNREIVADPDQRTPTVDSEPSELDTLMKKCTDVRDGFIGSVHRTAIALTPAYALFLYMKRGGSKAVDEVIDHPSFPESERSTQRKNVALVALLANLRPADLSERKWCSEWAPMLQVAADTGVSLEKYSEFAARTTLRECKLLVRSQKTDKAKAVPADWTLVISLSRPNERKRAFTATFYERECDSLLRQLIESKARSNQAADLFKALVEHCELGLEQQSTAND